MSETSFGIYGLKNPEEVAAGWTAILKHREKGEPLRANETEDVPVERATSEIATRILKGLFQAPLGPRYIAILKVWLAAPLGQSTGVHELAGLVSATNDQMRANLAKLSIRMRQIATPEELASLRTPFLLLAEIERGEDNLTKHRLTTAGREAVRRFLASARREIA